MQQRRCHTQGTEDLHGPTTWAEVHLGEGGQRARDSRVGLVDTEAATWLESDGCWEFGMRIREVRGQREIVGVDILAGGLQAAGRSWRRWKLQPAPLVQMVWDTRLGEG